jgi:hypothetical protein
MSGQNAEKLNSLGVFSFCLRVLAGHHIALQLSFAKKSLREICENSAEANRKVGVDTANELRRRLADLRAATSVHDLLVGEPRETDGSKVTLDVGADIQITLCPNHSTVPKLESGAIDWSKVNRVKILAVQSRTI